MSEANAGAQAQGKASHRQGDDKRSTPRKLAEWVSLGVSALLILGLAAVLVMEGLRPRSEFVPAQALALGEQAQRVGERFILPIKVENRGEQTLRELVVEVAQKTPDGKEETQEVTVDYLGHGSSVTVYAFLDHDPRTAKAEARTLNYRLD